MVHGVDTSPEMIDAATRLVPEAKFAVLKDSDLPFESESVDVIMWIAVQQYVPHELAELTKILREWRRVLRPEGLAIALEQVNDGNLGRAAPSSYYVDGFAEAGLATMMFKPIRLGHSRFVELAERHPRLAASDSPEANHSRGSKQPLRSLGLQLRRLPLHRKTSDAPVTDIRGRSSVDVLEPLRLGVRVRPALPTASPYYPDGPSRQRLSRGSPNE
jgi:SAM-dependent methyltransferase